MYAPYCSHRKWGGKFYIIANEQRDSRTIALKSVGYMYIAH